MSDARKALAAKWTQWEAEGTGPCVYDAILGALADRDFEWWQALCLVDNVAPEPGAVKAFTLAVNDYDLGLVRGEEREACASIVDGETCAGPCDCFSCAMLNQMAAAIRSRRVSAPAGAGGAKPRRIQGNARGRA